MNKYLLWVLLASTSVPAYSYVFEFQEGTMTGNDMFHQVEKKWPSNPSAYEAITYRNWSKWPGEWTFKGHWYSSSPYPITGTTGLQLVQIHLRDTFRLVSTEDPEGVWTTKGTSTFPSGAEPAYIGCTLPDTVTSDVFPSGGVLTYYIYGTAEATSTSTRESSTINVKCEGLYTLRKNVDIQIVDSVIELQGSTTSDLYGRTSMRVSGMGGPVSVRIENPNTSQVRVSFDPNKDVSSTTMDLTQQPQHEQQLYVRAYARVPGRHEYRVQLIGEFK